SGSHKLHVITSHNQHPVTATLHITVREPLPASTPSAVMSVTMAPSNARLEQFWDGTATVEIYAPEDSKISCELNFYSDVSCSKKMFARQFGPLAAPVSQSAFSSAFASVKAQSSVQNAY